MAGGDQEAGWGERLRKRFLAIVSLKSENDNIDKLIRSYGNGLYVAARGLSAAQGDAFDEMAHRIEAELGKGAIDVREIFALETQLEQLYPPDIKRRRYWEFRERFERIASPTQLAAYLASTPPPPPPADPNDPPSSPPAINNADNLVLLDHIHRNYLITLVREQAVRDLKRWIQHGLLRGLAVYSAFIAVLIYVHVAQLVSDQVSYFLFGLTLLYILGRVGAAMSVVQRLQRAVREPDRDPFFEVTALCTGRRGVSIAMMSGGVFALLLYVIFGAGLGQNLGMSGGIFPQVGEYSPADTGAGGTHPTIVSPEIIPIAEPARNDSGATNALSSAGADPGSSVAVATSPKPQQAGAALGGPECGADKAICMPTFVSEIGRHLGFRDYPDFFKMLLLAFLAGFAERLVPDAIDRITARSGGDSDRAAATVRAGSS